MLSSVIAFAALVAISEEQEFAHLPPYEHCVSMYSEAASFAYDVERKYDYAPTWQYPVLRATKTEADVLRDWWELMVVATIINDTEHYGPDVTLEDRRNAREDARSRLGQARWCRSEYPPAIPYWRLPRVP